MEKQITVKCEKAVFKEPAIINGECRIVETEGFKFTIPSDIAKDGDILKINFEHDDFWRE